MKSMISMENLVFLCWLLPSIWQKCVYFTWFRLDSIGNLRRFSGFHLRISSKFAHAWCLDSDQDVQLNIWWLGCKSKTIGIELNFRVYSWNTLEQIILLNLSQNMYIHLTSIPFTSSRRKNAINIILLACKGILRFLKKYPIYICRIDLVPLIPPPAFLDIYLFESNARTILSCWFTLISHKISRRYDI